jgi:hypothetical protein
MSTPKFCAECGFSLQPGAKFCPQCGTPQKVAAPVVVPEPKVEAKPEPKVQAPAAPEPAKADSGDHHMARHDGGSFVDPLASLLSGTPDHEDEDNDELGPPIDQDDLPDVAPQKKSYGGSLAFGILGIVVIGIVAYVALNEESNARFQCSVLKVQEKCETDEDRAFRIEQAQKQEENEYMVNHYGAFDLQFSPDADTVVVITQKRYEETRADYLARFRDGGEDKRGFKEKRTGVYTTLANKAGQSVGGIAFKSDASCNKPAECPDPSAAAAVAAEAGAQPDALALPPPSNAKPTMLPTCATWAPTKGKKLVLPMSLQNLPLLEKEQADGNDKRLTAEDIKIIDEKRKDPPRDSDGNPIVDASLKVHSVALSSWVYEVELASCGYKPRKVMFYEHPAPPGVDVKKLESEGWTVRKFKRTPDGRFVIDNAAFDLLPEPHTYRIRYIQLLKELYCLKESPEYKGKTDQGKKDAEELIWVQKSVVGELRDIAKQNDLDPKFVEYRDALLKSYECPKIEAQ